MSEKTVCQLKSVLLAQSELKAGRVPDCIKQRKQKDFGMKVGNVLALMETTEVYIFWRNVSGAVRMLQKRITRISIKNY